MIEIRRLTLELSKNNYVCESSRVFKLGKSFFYHITPVVTGSSLNIVGGLSKMSSAAGDFFRGGILIMRGGLLIQTGEYVYIYVCVCYTIHMCNCVWWC